MTAQGTETIDPLALLEAMTESVLVTDVKLVRPGPAIVYVNAAFERMTGWLRHEILGQSPRLLQGPKTNHEIFGDMRERLHRGEAWRGQTVNYRKDGSEFIMEWSIVPIVDESGKAKHYLAVQRDVSERVALEKSLAASRDLERKWMYQLENANRELSRVNDRQQKTLNLFTRYVPESVVQKGLATSNESLFHGEQLDIAVMFCDMRGFTSLSEKLAPDGVVALLNTFYRSMSNVIAAHEGVINQFVGDEIFVAFGAPQPILNCSRNAVLCALAMVERLQALNSDLNRLIGHSICVGIGLDYGPVVAGNLGSDHRISYSITGNTVNTTKRIESLAKAGTNTILIGEGMHAKVREIVTTQSWPPVSVKGKSEQVKVYEVLGLRNASAWNSP